MASTIIDFENLKERVSTALKLVTVDSESELPPEEEREDNVLYAVIESQSSSILRIAPKNQLNEIDVLNARINALEKYIERTFVKNTIEEVDVIDGGELDVIDNEPATL